MDTKAAFLLIVESLIVLYKVIFAVAMTTQPTNVSSPAVVIIDNKLVSVLDNCVVGDLATCPDGFCCTKQRLDYPDDYPGVKVDYQLECRPFRKSGEYCYFDTPENFCPCITRCHTNGYYGTCV